MDALIAQKQRGFGHKIITVKRIFTIEKLVWAMENAVSFKQNKNRSRIISYYSASQE